MTNAHQKGGPLLGATSAAAASNEFLELGWREPTYPSIDQMKLQKLLFYGHAWYLATHERPLFDEDIEAWPWGPVVRDVYYQTRSYGRGPVRTRITKLRWDPDAPLNSRFEAPDVADGVVKSFIRSVWETHKAYTGVQLSNSTHAPGEPWTIIKEQFQNLDSKPTIPNDLIAAVFKKKLENAPVR